MAPELGRLLVGSVHLRPYVFGFLAVYAVAATAEWGWRRAAAFAALAGSLAFTAEFASTRIGVPFGLYHYTGATRGAELYLGNVPFFDPLSFVFLSYASLGLARFLLTPGGAPGPATGRGGAGRRGALAVLAGVLMTWLDLVIDPLAVRGDRWFLGRIFYYPEPGAYFGVPIANFGGWAIVGTLIAVAWLVWGDRVGGRPPRWAARLPGRPLYSLALYHAILAFNLAVTAAVAEPALFWAGLAWQMPLAAVVVFCASSKHASSSARSSAPVRRASRPDEIGASS